MSLLLLPKIILIQQRGMYIYLSTSATEGEGLFILFFLSLFFFCRGLLRGMGKLRFLGRRYDGTSGRKEEEVPKFLNDLIMIVFLIFFFSIRVFVLHRLMSDYNMYAQLYQF